MGRTEWSKNDDLFINELRTGFEYQEIVAQTLILHGIETDIPALEIRDDISDIDRFADLEDIVITWQGKKLIMEVKSRALFFTGISDFPYREIFVETVKSWDQKKRKPTGIIIISQKTNKMFMIPGSSILHWKQKKAFDRKRRIKELFYTVDIKHCLSFDQMMERLT